ncbi:MAG: AI-2E family transporter [Candidatus Eremiobacteraeota bacterium]|nr:AI-2E family transporter [Candidatus Eremiobacteraeota bacterium]
MMAGPAWRATADAWFKLVAAIGIGCVLLAQAVALLQRFGDITIIAIGGMLLAYFVYPAVAWLNRRLPLWAALSIVYLSGLLCVALIFYLVIPAAVVQVQGLIGDWPTIDRSIRASFEGPQNPFFAHLPPVAQQWITKLPSQIATDLQQHGASYTSKVVNAITIIVGIAAVAIAIPVVSLYMLAESSMIKRFFLQCIKPRARAMVVETLHEIDQVIGGFIRGQIIVAVVIGILAVTALLVLHVRYPVLIGVWAGAMDIIPYLGPVAGAIPAVIVALIFNGPGNAAGVIVAFTLINQLEGHLLGPRIVSSTVKITPLTVIFALLICAKLFGFVGLIVAVPLAGIVRVLIVRLFEESAVSNAQLKPGLTAVPRSEVDARATK